MARMITIRAARARKGERMTRGGYQLVPRRGRKRIFSGSLIDTVNVGKIRIALFTVPK